MNASQSFDLAHLWMQGDFVIRGVAILLLIMSITTWSLLVIKGRNLWKLKQQSEGVKQFWHSNSLDEGLKKIGDASSPYYQLVEQGRHADAHHREPSSQLHDGLSRSDWISLCLRSTIDDNQSRMNSGLSVLASIGSTSPFIGLFGTVWGIYHALIGISAAGSASIDKVAGPIGEALIMTALGLAVAIPAVIAYNALLRGNRKVLDNVQRFAQDLHAWLLTGARVQAK
mgnify:FL=1